MSTTPRRFYIDRNTQQDEPVVRAVTVRRSPRPATHRAEPVLRDEPHREPTVPRVGKLVQSAIRRRSR